MTDLASSRLNPFDDPSPFGIVMLDTLDIGFVMSIDGAEKPEDWNVQKGTATKNATAVWKGTLLAEGIKIVVAAYDRSSFDGLYDLRDKLRPKIGKKPPSVNVINGTINEAGITRAALKVPGQNKWVAKGAYWTKEITLIEFNQSAPTNAGPADKPKWVDQPKKSPGEDELEKILAEAKKL